jgi:hypothetical protein
MEKLDSLSIPMIMGDWRLVILSVQKNISSLKAADFESLDDDEAASIVEDIDRLSGVLTYLLDQFENAYGAKPYGFAEEA